MVGKAPETEIVLVANAGRVRVLTLNRPEKLNALNDDLLGALGRAVAEAAIDDGVHVLVLTGAGRAFSAGADLTVMADAPRGTSDAPTSGKQMFEHLQASLESFPKPLVAAVNGLGIGFGFTLLGYCDFSLVAQGARFRTPFSQLGLSPEASSSYLFPLRMGWATAARALMLGDWFSAEDAVACGLAQQVVESHRLMETTLALAERLAQCPLQSLIVTKQLMLEAHLPHMRAARAREGDTMSTLIGTPANREAVRAFASRKAGG